MDSDPSAHGQRTPVSLHQNCRSSNNNSSNNNKNNNNNNIIINNNNNDNSNSSRSRKGRSRPDGAVSDGAIINPSSPRLKKGQHRHTSSFATGAATEQHTHVERATRQRPISLSVEQRLATPAKEQAYAGPTFQSSPAASSLPLPSLYKSKTVPQAGPYVSLQDRLASESALLAPRSPFEPGLGSAPEPSCELQQSPLNFLFQADKKEKDRLQRESNSLSPECFRRLPPAITVAEAAYADAHEHLFPNELDGDVPSRARELPSKRPVPISRAHTCPARTEPPRQSSESGDDERKAVTQTLKQLLFATASTPPRTHSHDKDATRSPGESFGSPSPLPSSARLSTPRHGVELPDHYSLHYGDRNLSNLFKAARSGNSPLPCSLWEEEEEQQQAPNLPGNSSPQHHPTIDPHAFAPFYLNQQIGTPSSVGMRPLHHHSPHPLREPSNKAMAMPSSAQLVNAQHSGPTPSSPIAPCTRGPDVRHIEDNLRRLLKIA